ncbi:MAG: hypothetical protein HY096_16025 [Nitrospinae bacterium]|nr:hypothetical protein [Nitrospinota bacterium]
MGKRKDKNSRSTREKKQVYKLVCEGNPKVLGIEDAEGNWDMKKFKGHIISCPECREFASTLLQEVGNMWQYRYMFPNGSWQNWAIADDFQEASENCQFHSEGRPFEIIRAEIIEEIEQVIEILRKTKGAFKSKLVEEARERLERII